MFSCWFYQKVPSYTKLIELAQGGSPNGGYTIHPGQPSASVHPPLPSHNQAWPFHGGSSSRLDSPGQNSISSVGHRRVSSTNTSNESHFGGKQRQLPIPPDQQQRLKTVPRPRITPSWVHEKVQSSMSIGSEDDESSSSSVDVAEFKQSITSIPAPMSSRRNNHNRSKDSKHRNSSGSFSSTLPTNSASTSARSMQRYILTNRRTDTGLLEALLFF